jgi:hypothetical protein
MKKGNFRWPKEGDDPFPENIFTPQSRTWVNLEWRKWSFNDSSFAQAFKEAGDNIITQLSRKGNRRHPDMLFMPIAYLYRHSLELQLKQIIRLGIDLEVVQDNEKLRRALSRHNLHSLWNYVKKAVDGVDPGSSSTKDFSTTESIIQRFHSIDMSGQRLRYSKNLSGGKPSTDLPKFVELKHLKEVYEGLFNLLEGIECYLTEALVTISDMPSSGC